MIVVLIHSLALEYTHYFSHACKRNDAKLKILLSELCNFVTNIDVVFCLNLEKTSSSLLFVYFSLFFLGEMPTIDSN